MNIVFVYIEAFHEALKHNIKFVVERKLLSNDWLKDYANYSVHSVLQYCLMKTEVDLCPIPEYKIKLKKPMDKFEVDGRFKEKKARYQKFIKVDIAYLKDLEIVGFGEVFTPDEIHGVLESKELSEPWLTPRHKIKHLIVNNKPKFFIVVNIMSKLPSWKNAKLHTLEQWEKIWIEFIKKVCEQQRIECLHTIIKSIEDIDYYPYVIS